MKMWNLSGLAVAMLVCGSAMAQVQDLTRQEGAAGPQVVEAVVSLIHESCVFPNDRLLLRRIAYFATNDGQDPGTYRAGFYGGIWAIPETDFRVTQNDANLQQYYSFIINKFGIDWSRVTWPNLTKPLYSGLAAALFMVQNFYTSGVPVGAENQATWFQKLAYPNDPGMAYNFTKLAQQLDNACSSSNLDIAFIVDSSSSLSPADFNVALRFAADVLGGFTVSPIAVQVALMTFSTGFQTVFDFDQYNNKIAVQSAIRAAQYHPGQTDTDQALQYAATQLFTPGASGARLTSAKVAVLITDGAASHSADAVMAAQELKNKGVTLFVIGVGDQINQGELDAMATQPSCTHVQVLKGYGDLESLKAEIQLLSCRAPVVLQDGNFNFPCRNTNNFRVAINNNETITLRTSAGDVEVYGSFLNPYPNRAFNEFSLNASSSQDAIIYVRGETRPLYLSVVSQGSNPSICPAGGNFSIVVQNKNALHPSTSVVCYENGITRECTPLDYLLAMYVVERPSSLGFPSPCQPPRPGYFRHPFSSYQFIYCDSRGVPYVVHCPSGYWYNDAGRICQFGNPPTSAPAVTTPRPAFSTAPPQVVTQGPVGANPCTPEALSQGIMFFPYAMDPHKYIACTEWPNYGVVKDCALNHIWSQHDLTCIYERPYDGHQFVTDPVLVQVNCTLGLGDGAVFFHPYPHDNTKYIQCDQYGSAFVKQCPNEMIWNQHFGTCIFGPHGGLVG